MGRFCHSRPSISFRCQVEQWGFFSSNSSMLLLIFYVDWCWTLGLCTTTARWWWWFVMLIFFFARWSVNLRTQFSSRALLLVCRRKLRLLSNQFYFLMWFARKKHSNRFTICTYNGFRIMCGVFWNGNVLLLSINVMRSDDGRVDLQINIVNA